VKRAEVVSLLKEVRAYCPAQQFDEATTAIWVRDLAGFDPEYVAKAVRELLNAPRDLTDRPRYLHLGDLLSRAKALARQTTNGVALPPPPPKASSPQAREEWSQDQMQARNTGNFEAFLRKWYGVGNLAEITRGDE